MNLFYLLPLSWCILLVHAIIDSRYSLFSSNDKPMRLMFDRIASSHHGDKYDYLILLESLPRKYFSHLSYEYVHALSNVSTIFDMIDEIIHSAFFWHTPEDDSSLAVLFMDIIYNLHFLSHDYHPSEYADRLPVRWWKKATRLPDSTNTGILLMSVVKEIVAEEIPFIHEYLRREYEQFRPYLYALNDNAMLLPYECKRLAADLLLEAPNGLHTEIFVKFLRHRVFTPEVASNLVCGSHSGTSKLILEQMELYDGQFKQPVAIPQKPTSHDAFSRVRSFINRHIRSNKIAHGDEEDNFEDETFAVDRDWEYPVDEVQRRRSRRIQSSRNHPYQRPQRAQHHTEDDDNSIIDVLSKLDDEVESSIFADK